MKNSNFYVQLAKNNIIRNLRNYIPFWLSCMTVVVFFFNLSNLQRIMNSASSVYGNLTVAGFLGFGTWIVGILSTIFVFYANSFLMKNRKKELALYGILGLGKRNIAVVLLLETIFTSFTAIFSGLVVGAAFGKVFFLIMRKLVNYETGVKYEVYGSSIISTLWFFMLIFAIVLLFNLISMHLTEPIELLKSKNIGEKRVKFLVPRFLIGAVSLAAGYYLAATVKNPIKAISIFFWATLLVIIGTYFLFLAGSVVVLNALKKSKRFYYKPSNFISTSSLIYRMKKNAVGLASICILSCMVIVTVATTASVYGENSRNLNKRFPKDYFVIRNVEKGKDINRGRNVFEQLAQDNGLELIHEDSVRKQELILRNVDGNFEHTAIDYYLADKTDDMRYVIVVTQEDYERITGKDLDVRLKENEVVLVAKNVDKSLKELRLFHKNYKVAGHVDDDFRKISQDAQLMSRMMKSWLLVVSDLDIMFHLYDGASVEEKVNFDLKGKKENVKLLESAVNQSDERIIFQIKETNRTDIYSLTGGLYFVGIFLGGLFLLLTVLIIYFKQISEGEEDRERFSILQKVGLSSKEAGKVIRKQLVMMFFLPLVTTIVHVGVATIIIARILTLAFGILLSNVIMYMLVTVVIFSVIYFIVYLWTSKVYYNVVYSEQAD